MTDAPSDLRSIDALLAIMAALRNPQGGCPWDLEQSYETIAPYTIEEAYEVADAVHRGDPEGIKGELGDLLFQVVFHAQIAKDLSQFVFADVVESICEKMIRRHPHVFGDTVARDPDAVRKSWDAIKAQERAAKDDGRSDPASVLDDVPAALPALLRTSKLVSRVAKVGFDWDDAPHALEKVFEEARELKDALVSGSTQEHVAEELGDLLFTVANVAYKLGLNPEEALSAANRKFERRFRGVERRLTAEGRSVHVADLPEMDAHWDAIKREEKTH